LRDLTKKLPGSLKDLDYLNQHPELLLISIDLIWILFPLFFIYIQKTTLLPKERISHWLIYPGLITLVIQIVLLIIIPYSTKDLEIYFALFDGFFFLGFCFSLIIVLRTNRYLIRSIKEVVGHFTIGRNRYTHLLLFSALYFITALIRIWGFSDEDSFNNYLSLFIISFLATLPIPICGLLRINVFNIVRNLQLSVGNTKSSDENSTETTVLVNLKLNDLIIRLDSYMTIKEVFVEKELTIVDVAKTMDEHPRRISSAINKIYHKNFNTYINNFRVKKAERLLISGEADKLSIEGLGIIVGFNSKSAFYSAFKKVTGTTPSKYKEYITS